MSLIEYRRKRRFERTPEPSGERERDGDVLRFVVQKHDATRLHYDFRLELGGVLKSWAVPKGPSLNPADKRLAVRVEDHPLDYRTFEGTIPAGNYGAGEVIVWDEGTYEPTESGEGRPNERLLREGLEAGRLSITLHGYKLNGGYSLVRTGRAGERNGKNWLLIKKRDRWASERDVTKDARSVLNGQKLPSPRQRASRRNKRSGSSTRASGSSRAKMPKDIRPMLATLVDGPFDRPGWLFEVKWDGYRSIAEIDHGKVRLYSRNHNSFNRAFPPVVQSLKRLDHAVVLDGEVVALDGDGRSQFQLLQNYRRTGAGRLVYCVFDLLFLNGRDLRREPLRVRRQLLESIIGKLPNVAVSETIAERGIDFFRAVVDHGLEGIMAKDAESPYREGQRSREWLKIKTHNRQEAVIGGFTVPRRSREHLGAVVLGIYEGPDLVYIGHTGGGSDARQLAELRAQLDPFIQEQCPFRIRPKVNAPVKWVAPRIVCEVRFQEWTSDGRMRQPILLGVRPDKSARSVRRETPKQTDDMDKSNRQRRHRKDDDVARKSGPAPVLTNQDKIFWPDEGYTKGDLIDYYRDMAPLILPYLRNRPLSLHRHPNGIEGKSFFQKDVSRQPPPDWVKTIKIPSESTGRTGRYVICQNVATLLYLANLGCIEINPWNARVESLDHPDYMVLDLDPVDTPFARVIEVATAVREVLEDAGIESVCKTSGKRGLHIFVPLEARYSNEESRQFAELIAQLVHARLPESTSLIRNPRQRRGRVYIDYLQNRHGQTVVAAYSVRPSPGATISMPLAWREVRKGLDPSSFTIETARRRIDRVGDRWQPVLGPGVDLLVQLKKLAEANEAFMASKRR